MFLPLTFWNLTLTLRTCLVSHLCSNLLLLIVLDNFHPWLEFILKHLLDIFLSLINLLVFVLNSDHFKGYFWNELWFNFFFIINVDCVNYHKVIPIDLRFFFFLNFSLLFWLFLLEDFVFISLFDWFSNTIDWSELINFLDEFFWRVKYLWVWI